MLDRILIDPRVFAGEGRRLEGRIALKDLDKRIRSQDLADLSPEIAYAVCGGTDRRQRLFLNLSVRADLSLHCQRCLNPLDFRLDETARIILFDNEAELDEAMCADDDLEGTVCGAVLDVSALLEDQILMALPYAPKHEACVGGLEADGAVKNNAFAVLAGLKKPDSI